MLTSHQQKLAARAVRPKKVFLLLSIISVVVGLSLAGYYTFRAITQPDFDAGVHFVLVVLILLNGRQNLRQYHYARILETLQ